MVRQIQDFIWHVQENVWEYFFYLALGLIFVVWPISAWLGRKKRRKELRELMGPAYADYKSCVRMAAGICADAKTNQFAVAARKVRTLFRSDEITELKFTLAVASGISVGTLMIETSSESCPRIYFQTMFINNTNRLGEIFDRLKKMQPATETSPAPEGATLENAIRQLTDEVSSLTDTIKQLALKDGSHPPS